MTFDPPKARGLAAAVGLALPLLAGMVLAFNVASAEPPTVLNSLAVLAALALVVPLGWLIYRALGLVSARYRIAAGALEVSWGARREVIPLHEIEEAHPAHDFPGELRPRGLNLPGCIVSRIQHPQLGMVEFLTSSEAKTDCVMLGYSGGWLVVSPNNPRAFLNTVLGRRGAAWAPTGAAATPAASLRPGRLGRSLLEDRLALGLAAAGLIGMLTLLTYLLLIFPQLPPQLALRFRADGSPERFGPPEGILILPAIAAVAFVLNLGYGAYLHSRPQHRLAAYVLLGATPVVQVLIWVATFAILFAGGP
jgi:hypothetical protein